MLTSDDPMFRTGALHGAFVASTGDTLQEIEGAMVGLNGASGYGLHHYRVNGRDQVVVQKLVDHRADGTAVWWARSRLALPPVAASERVILTAACSRDGVPDPLLGAVVEDGTDAVYRRIRLAFRFERAPEALVLVPIDGVTCANQ